MGQLIIDYSKKIQKHDIAGSQSCVDDGDVLCQRGCEGYESAEFVPVPNKKTTLGEAVCSGS